MDGSSWLTSQGAVPQLVQACENESICPTDHLHAAKANGPDARILSISQPSGSADLNVRQDGPALVFWFRNGISAKKSQLVTHVPELFKSGEMHDILYSYDGSNLTVYVDGKSQPIHYKLGPGATLATFVGHRVKTTELVGYNYIYYALVFFPAGVLLGIAARQMSRNRFAGYATFGVAILMVPTLLEFLLVAISGRAFSAGESSTFDFAHDWWHPVDQCRSPSGAPFIVR